MNNTIIQEKVKELIKIAFNTGHDQGMHEVKEPDFDMFYRNCWEDDLTEALTSLVKEKYNEGFYDGVKAQQDIVEKEYQAQFEDCKKGRHGDAEDNGFGKPAICSICGEDLQQALNLNNMKRLTKYQSTVGNGHPLWDAGWRVHLWKFWFIKFLVWEK